MTGAYGFFGRRCSWSSSSVRAGSEKMSLLFNRFGLFLVAERSYAEAIEVACSQSAKGWELRAAIGLARLWHSLGRTAEAHDLLAPVYGWFTEGFDTADPRGAKSLLRELS